jgi:1-acyl-sn-glycerol-3-phosphate acyltransferase
MARADSVAAPEAGGVSDAAGTRGRSGSSQHGSNGAGPDENLIDAARERVAGSVQGAGLLDVFGGLAGAATGALTGAAGRLAERLLRVPEADLDARDPDYIRESLPGLWMLCSLYFRAEVRGLHNIPPKGPVLLVGNHSGGNLSPDVFVFPLAFSTYFGVERRFHQLAHNLVVSWPGIGPMLRKHGTVAASHANAAQALDSGAALLVYPGGDYEVHRPSWQSSKVDFGGRKGFISLALDRGVPIVPVVAIGGQETALFLSRGEWLARLLRLDTLLRLKVLPILIAPPWGLVIGDMAGRIPLPAKITMEVMAPIDLGEEFGPDPDLDEVYDEVTTRMQGTLTALASERSLPVIG